MSVRDFLPRSLNISRTLRRVMLGGAMALLGGAAFAAVPQPTSTIDSGTPALIVNRDKKQTKLVLQLPSTDGTKLFAQHRSHSSHSSHRSHSSHSSHRSRTL
jgi:hypothetical protein